jgi:hypothetical protein
MSPTPRTLGAGPCIGEALLRERKAVVWPAMAQASTWIDTHGAPVRGRRGATGTLSSAGGRLVAAVRPGGLRCAQDQGARHEGSAFR